MAGCHGATSSSNRTRKEEDRMSLLSQGISPGPSSVQSMKKFKSDIKAILEDEESYKIDLSLLPNLYANKFGNKFNHKSYPGFNNRKICKMVQKPFMSSMVSIIKIGSVTYLQLKEPNSSRRSSIHDGRLNGMDDSIHDDRLDENMPRNDTENPAEIDTSEPDLQQDLMDTFSSRPKGSFSLAADNNVGACATNILETHAPNIIEIKPVCQEQAEYSQQMSNESTTGIRAINLQTEKDSDLDCLKHDVMKVLSDEGGRVEMSKFKSLYKKKFGGNFNARAKYGIRRVKKLSAVLNLIPDVVSLTSVGSDVIMELTGTTNHGHDEEHHSSEDTGDSLLTRNDWGPAPVKKEQTSFQSIMAEQQEMLLSDVASFNSFGMASWSTATQQNQVQLEQQQQKEQNIPMKVPEKKKRKIQKPEDDMMLSSPSPFETSFNASQSATSFRSKPSRQLYNTPSKLNELAKKVITEIADEGCYVSLSLVKAKMAETIGVRDLKDMGYRNPDNDVPELRELQRLHSKLDLFARAYVMVHSIATLSELGQSMARLVDKIEFSDLKVGPLVKLPVIYDLFKAPSDDTALQSITTMQVLKNLNTYLTKEDKWTSKVDLDKFIEFLCNEYGCRTAYELGLRIQSIGLGISVLKRAQRAQSDRSKAVEQELVEDLEREFIRRCKKIKEELLGASHGDERSLIHKLLGTSVSDVLTAIFDHCGLILQHDQSLKQKDFNQVQMFLKCIVQRKSLREIFNMALHLGCKSIVKDILEEFKEEIAERLTKEQEKKKKETRPPKKGELVENTKKWLNSAEDLKLTTLSLIEDRIIEPHRPDFNSFVEFGHGTFLEFLSKQPKLKKIIDERGVSAGVPMAKVSLSRDMGVLNFIHQCGQKTENCETAVCNYYGVSSIKDLGHGDYKTIISELNRKPIDVQNVFYEAAILCKDGRIVSPSVIISCPTQSCTQNVSSGIMGWKNPSDALQALESAALLCDLQEWTQWSTVFGPCLGELKQFIQRHSQIKALESTNKRLLRVDTNTTPEMFFACVDNNDVIGASGNLISLVVKNGGVKSTPLALLANHMTPALSKLASADQKSGGLSCPKFVLGCLCRMPVGMCVALCDKVFLEPLCHVLGTANAYQQILSCCINDSQLSRLHQIGLGLGKDELMKHFTSAMTCETKGRIYETEVSQLKPVAIVTPVSLEEPFDVDVAVNQLNGAEAVNEDGDVELEEGKETSSILDPLDSKEEDDIDKPNPCKELIETIRREEFGIGLELGEEEKKLFQKQREREGRSLNRLSTELYNKDIHFVLELVQNADDNSYPGGEVPAIKFVVDSTKIVIMNNEVGFIDKNIRALCDVGKSTKGPHQYGYIGQKGIGFKSVFRISDTPEVHSNGFHIRFDAKSGHSGYILPHWVDDTDDGNHEDASQWWMTKIVLPLKEEFHGDKKTSLAVRFNEVHPSLLLFLHRLRCITIQIDNRIQTMTRQDLSDGVIQISHGEKKDRWLVVKKQLTVGKVREDVEMTELAIAFPIHHDQDFINRTLPRQKVFAYLPLRSYGFKFIIQGDFEVPSSREDVDSDKAWNQWLREEIPKLFIEALEVFKCFPSFVGLSSVVRFFQFVPLEEEILDFFSPVASSILKYLQGMACLPAENTARNDGKKDQRLCKDFKWVQPCTLLVCEDPVIHKFISPDLLQAHLNLNYLVPEMISSMNPALKMKLGIRSLSIRHIIDIGRAVSRDLRHDSKKSIEWISQWLHCVYRCLDNEHNSSTDVLDEIGSMEIFPLTSSKLVNLKENAVFFPLSSSKTTKSKEKKSKNSYIDDLERDLSVLHADVLSFHGDDGVKGQVVKLLTRLGVKSWTPSELINNHILPTLKSEKWKDKSDSVIKSYLVYIFDQRLIDRSLCPMNELKDVCQIVTNNGLLNPSKTPVHFTPAYGYDLDLASKLPSISWTLIDDSYAELSSIKTASKQDWKAFFTELGVCDFLAIERKTIKVNKLNEAESPWSSFVETWPETADDVYFVEDYCSNELDQFMQLKDKKPNQAKLLAKTLDEHWDDKYSPYADYVTVKDSKGREISKTLSSFLMNLRESSWLPILGSSKETRIPRELFSDQKDIRLLLDDHVDYVDVQFRSESFVKSIGLKASLSVEDVLNHLISWSKKNESKNNPTFSLPHITRVYSYFHEQCSMNTNLKPKITDAFKRNPLIFIPEEGKLGRPVHGRFYRTKDACWNDPSKVALKLQESKKYCPKRQILCWHYKDQHDFLRLQLGVDNTPHTDEYIEMCNVLVSESSIPTPPIVELIRDIFAVLGQKCRGQRTSLNHEASNFCGTEHVIDDNVAKYLNGKLQDEAVFPCGERWNTLSERPIIPDDKQMKKIFEKEKNVHFLTLESSLKTRSISIKKLPKAGEEKKEDDVKVFLNACGIKSLSEIIEEELIPHNVVYGCHDVQRHFHRVIPCIQRYLYFHMEERYKVLKDTYFGRKLSDMTFASVTKLEVVYHLKGFDRLTVDREMKYGSDCIGNTLHFYAVKDLSMSTDSLNEAIVKLFVNNKSIKLENFLSSLNNKLDQGLEDFLENQEVEELPDDEEAWFVPEPMVQSSPQTDILDELEPPPKIQRKTQKDDGEIHCWPPRSSVTGAKVVVERNEPVNKKNPELWVLPEAPESINTARLHSYIAAATVSAVSEAKRKMDAGNKEEQDSARPCEDIHRHNIIKETECKGGEEQNPLAMEHLPKSSSNQPLFEGFPLTPVQSTAAYPSDGTILPAISPSKQPLAASTPNDALGSPSVFSPKIHISFEDLYCEELSDVIGAKFPLNLSSNDNYDKANIGRWGEEAVYRYLKDMKQDENWKREIIWMNEKENSTAPFDIQVTSIKPNEAQFVTYIEVKSTLQEGKEHFEISLPELRFALEQRENLHLYRVFKSANSQNARIIRVQNLAKHVEKKSVRMYMVVGGKTIHA